MIADSACDRAKLRLHLAKENIALHASTNRRHNKNQRQIKPGGR